MNVTIDKNISALLNFFRWFSALLVLLSHSRSIIFVPWGEVENPGGLTKVFYFVSAWGDYGVLMFFAISGYLIGGGVLEKLRRGDFCFGQYFIDRWTRIYVVLIPALLLISVLDAYGLHFLNGAGIYTRDYLIGALPFDTREVTGWKPWLANLFMLQGLLTPPYGTAQPLWSLNWEWWSYLVAPFSVGLLLRFEPRHALLLGAGLGLLCAWLGLGYLLLWHIGIVLALIRFRSSLLLSVMLGICLVLPVLTRASLLPAELLTQLVFVACFTVLLSQLRHYRGFWTRFSGLHERLASFSFSLYILHNSVLVFVMAMLQTYLSMPRQLQPVPSVFGFYVAMLLSIYALAYLFAAVTEKNTGRLRLLLSTWVNRKGDK